MGLKYERLSHRFQSCLAQPATGVVQAQLGGGSHPAGAKPEHMNYPGSYFHPLKGGRAGRHAVRLTANYRVTFGWDEDGAPFAFQVTMDADYVDEDCFAKPDGPLIVPARTFLSQLL